MTFSCCWVQYTSKCFSICIPVNMSGWKTGGGESWGGVIIAIVIFTILIIAIDNRFVSKRVNQLKDWNIKFYQGEVLDKIFLKEHLQDADIVHHLAGVTDVAYVKKESSPGQDEKIKK